MSTDSDAGGSLRAGDMVEVRSLDEILATLDEQGELDALPFMPEMVQYCGRRMTVYKVANKLCDTISGNIGMRRMHDAVHLTAARCDGSGHGGCQAACMLFWKTAWFRPVRPVEPRRRATPTVPALRHGPHASSVTTDTSSATGARRPRCSGRPRAIAWPRFGQYVEDVRTGNMGVARSLRAFLWRFTTAFNGSPPDTCPAGSVFATGVGGVT